MTAGGNLSDKYCAKEGTSGTLILFIHQMSTAVEIRDQVTSDVMAEPGSVSEDVISIPFHAVTQFHVEACAPSQSPSECHPGMSTLSLKLPLPRPESGNLSCFP